ncbi:MAG: helix-turn-helix domain-containing protein [Haliea sp.]|nr:helix-turn-helix domain-containing protein [Haliea sp.]MDP5065543.1 helix-turn-helix domain-containing protein [Haliea sp.]
MTDDDSVAPDALVSLAEALVAALLSEDAETAFVEETRQFVDQLGDTLTLPVSEMISIDQLGQQARRELLEETLHDLGLNLRSLDWSSQPLLAREFQNRIWLHLYRRFLSAYQVVSSHIELLPPPAEEYPRPLYSPPESWLLLFAESGSCRVLHPSGDVVLGNNGPALLLLPPEAEVVLCRGSDTGSCSVFSSAFFPPQRWMQWLGKSDREEAPRALPVADTQISAYLSESFRRIIDIAHSTAQSGRALHLNLLEHILLLRNELIPRSDDAGLDRRVLAARDFLLAHYREKTTVEQVANAAGAAPSTLTALFKSQMGENLMRWRDQLRMRRARELLQGSDVPIKVIAAEVGYDDPMFFSRRFKQLTGWSPSQVRSGSTH